MKKFGQDRAMENGGLDLTHYTPAFSDAVYDEFHLTHVGPTLAERSGLDGVTAEPEPGVGAAARLNAALELEDFETAAQKVFAAARANPELLPLIELRGLVRGRIGDFEGAASDLGMRGDDGALPHEMRIALLESLCITGDMDAALKVAKNLLADEFETAAIYNRAAQAAQHLGRTAEAAFYAKQAFRRDHQDLSAALQALTILAGHSDPGEVAEWRTEILDNMSSESNGAFEICLWAVENRDDAMFTAAIGSVRARDKAGVIGLLEKATEAGMYRAVADCIPLARDLGRMDPGLSQRRADIFQWALDEAARLVAAGQPVAAHELTGALSELSGESAAALRLEKFAMLATRLARSVERDVLKSIRAAYAQGEQETVVRLGENSVDLLSSDPDAGVIVARSLQTRERSEDAIRFLTAIQEANPDHFGARRWLARYAAFARNYGLAIRMYGGLDRSHPGFKSVAAEVDRFFASVEPRAIKQLRELLESDQADEAFALLDALKAHTSAEEACDRELMRKHGNLRRRLTEIERGERDLEERESILRMMLRIDPADSSALRRLALECMRQFRFAEAAEYWEKLRSLSPDNESVVRNRERCQILARRRVNSLVRQAAA
jgi:tetratricopeptide (TPR) repeat protein